MKAYNRTENGTTVQVSVREALAEINHAMMAGKKDVREMSSGRGHHVIEYKDGRSVRLIEIEASETETADWSGTATRPQHLHRFVDGEKALCNSGIRPRRWLVNGAWSPIFYTRSEIENKARTDRFQFCHTCKEA